MTCGGGSSSRGEEGASFRKGWDLPARPPRRAAARPRLILGSRLPGHPGRLPPPHPPLSPPRVSGSHHPSGPRVVTRGWSRAAPVGPLLSPLWTRSPGACRSPNKRKDGIWDPPPGGYLFLTCCNLLVGSLRSPHLGLLHRAAKIHFRAHRLNAVRRRSALSRGFLSSGRTNTGPTSDPGEERHSKGALPATACCLPPRVSSLLKLSSSAFE